MLKLIALVIVVLVALVLVYAATRPDTFRVERSIDIKAGADRLFAYINDFHRWQEWTPYNKDPAMKQSYGATAAGRGATYAWEGNREVGKGEIAITDAMPPGRIEFELHMIAPFDCRNRVVFTLTPQGNATRVTWAMDGKSSFPGKLIGLFMDMDKMVGKDFEAGLAKLKSVAEK